MKPCNLFILVASAATCAKPPENTCYSKGSVYKKDEVFFRPGQCARFECMSNNVIMEESCASLQPRPNCTITPEDNSKPFPECCPQYKWDEGVACYFGGKTYKTDEEFVIPGQCAKFLCKDVGIYQNICNRLEPRPKCTITDVDNSKQYPECCPQYKCDEGVGCYIDGNYFQKYDVFYKPGQCKKFLCYGEDHLKSASCAKKHPRPNCIITAEDNSKLFPKCCPQYKCDENAGCYIDGKIFEKNEDFFRPGQCKRFTCIADGLVRETFCLPRYPRPHCTITAEDNSKTFPECCPEYECDENAGCYIDGRIYEKNEEFFKPGKCSKFKCIKHDNLREQICPPIDPRPNCTIMAVDNSKHFPDCCPHYKCAEEVACYHDGKNYKKHEVFGKPGQCTQFVCMDDDVIGQYTCAQLEPQSNCRITAEDNSKQFPQCCPEYKCS